MSGLPRPAFLQQLATLTLNLASGLSAGTVIPIQFTSSPVPRSVSDALGADLPANYVDGSIPISTGCEGDAAPRSSGNNLVNVADVTVLGRIVAGLESSVSAAEFQRADCAPRSRFGNGAINAGDLTQVARYVAGFNPQTPAQQSLPCHRSAFARQGAAVLPGGAAALIVVFLQNAVLAQVVATDGAARFVLLTGRRHRQRHIILRSLIEKREELL